MANPGLWNSGDEGRGLSGWELPPVVIVGATESSLFEEARVGAYGQPRWTATRRVPTTRIYVVPEGKVEVETWARGTFDDGESSWRFLQELKIGLPGRFQLDFYLRQDYDRGSLPGMASVGSSENRMSPQSVAIVCSLLVTICHHVRGFSIQPLLHPPWNGVITLPDIKARP